MPEAEEFLPLLMARERVPPVAQVRSTLIASSMRALQTRGDFDRYRKLLPEKLRGTLPQVVAGTWLPIGEAYAHYEACNQLGYGPREFAEMGKDVGNRIHGTLLSTAVRMAKGAGVTPWTIYAQFGRLWERTFIGGAITVRKVGPKEAHVEVVGQPLVAIAYYQAAQRATFLGLIELFCQKAYAGDVRSAATSINTTYRFAWA